MFTKLANEIDFNDIEAFCGKWGEGVRVEYKSKTTTESLRKTISSFANTQGGILIIGVDADKERNKARFPIQGIPNNGGIEEWIMQSATDGIYPSILPEVIICDVPGETGNVVVVVRVEESQQAPHAIQNTDRVYIRVASVTQPHKPKDESKIKDAGIDRIEYLLKRREEPRRISRQILERIEERVRTMSYRSQLEQPNLTIFARPLFPFRPIIDPSEIYEFMVLHPLIPSTASNINLNTRKVSGGVCYMQTGESLDFWELNEYGIIYHRTGLERERFQGLHSFGDIDTGEEKYLDAEDIGGKVYKFLGNAEDFYERYEYLGNIEITVKLQQIKGEKIVFREDRHPSFAEDRESVEPEVSASTQCVPRDLSKADFYADSLIGLLNRLFWVFNLRENEAQWQDGWREYVAGRIGR